MEKQLSMNIDPFHTQKLAAKPIKHECNPIYSIEAVIGDIVLEKTCQFCGLIETVVVKTGFGLPGNKTISELFKEETTTEVDEPEQNENLPFKKLERT